MLSELEHREIEEAENNLDTIADESCDRDRDGLEIAAAADVQLLGASRAKRRADDRGHRETGARLAGDVAGCMCAGGLSTGPAYPDRP